MLFFSFVGIGINLLIESTRLEIGERKFRIGRAFWLVVIAFRTDIGGVIFIGIGNVFVPSLNVGFGKGDSSLQIGEEFLFDMSERAVETKVAEEFLIGSIGGGG